MRLYKNKDQLLNCSFNFATMLDESKDRTHTTCLWRVHNTHFDLTNHHTAWAFSETLHSCLFLFVPVTACTANTKHVLHTILTLTNSNEKNAHDFEGCYLRAKSVDGCHLKTTMSERISINMSCFFRWFEQKPTNCYKFTKQGTKV